MPSLCTLGAQPSQGGGGGGDYPKEGELALRSLGRRDMYEQATQPTFWIPFQKPHEEVFRNACRGLRCPWLGYQMNRSKTRQEVRPFWLSLKDSERMVLQIPTSPVQCDVQGPMFQGSPTMNTSQRRKKLLGFVWGHLGPVGWWVGVCSGLGQVRGTHPIEFRTRGDMH